jgi:hypothetical protein
MQFAVFAVIIVVIIRSQPVPAPVDMQRLRGSLWPPLAMAAGFAISIPLYVIIGQAAFAAWGVAPILSNLLHGQLQRRRRAKATESVS